MIQSFDGIPKDAFRGLVRRIDNQGRIVVPKEYCRELGLDKDGQVELFLLADGLLLKPWPTERGGPMHMIDFLGRLCVPVDVRKALGIQYLDELEVFLLSYGMFLRKKLVQG